MATRMADDKNRYRKEKLFFNVTYLVFFICTYYYNIRSIIIIQLLNQSINQLINQSIDQSVSQSIKQSINQSINQSITNREITEIKRVTISSEALFCF